MIDIREHSQEENEIFTENYNISYDESYSCEKENGTGFVVAVNYLENNITHVRYIPGLPDELGNLDYGLATAQYVNDELDIMEVNRTLFPDTTFIEIFPKEENLVNQGNTKHYWLYDLDFQSIGNKLKGKKNFTSKLLFDDMFAQSYNIDNTNLKVISVEINDPGNIKWMNLFAIKNKLIGKDNEAFRIIKRDSALNEHLFIIHGEDITLPNLKELVKLEED